MGNKGESQAKAPTSVKAIEEYHKMSKEVAELKIQNANLIAQVFMTPDKVEKILKSVREMINDVNPESLKLEINHTTYQDHGLGLTMDYKKSNDKAKTIEIKTE